jgi:hypothetical protein
MKLRNCCLLLVGVWLASSVAAFSREVRTDFDHHANFSQYRTYSFAKVETPDPLWDDRVKTAIDSALTAKGWTRVPFGGDVSIVVVGTTREKPTLRTFYEGFDGWRWGGFGEAETYVDNYEVGTLVVDMFDTYSKKLIWRGSASDVLTGKPDKDEKRLEKAVEKMFEHFPPKSMG